MRNSLELSPVQNWVRYYCLWRVLHAATSGHHTKPGLARSDRCLKKTGRGSLNGSGPFSIAMRLFGKNRSNPKPSLPSVDFLS